MFNRLTIIVIALVFVGCANQNNEKYVASNAPAIQKEDKDDKLDVESQKPYKTPKEKAFEDAKKLAEQGNAVDQINLAVMYEDGNGVPKDFEQALYWYTKAAEQGYPDAQYNLGILYLEGDGVPQDSEQALYWFFKSAEQGFPDAQRNLGVSYLRGDIIPQNDKQGVYWLTKAAMQGNAPAQYSLGYSYMNGRGVPQNAKLAYAWFNLSASQGNENGVKGRNLMANNLSAYQLSQAQDLTVELQQEIEQYNESQKSEDSKLKTDIKISSSGTGFIITNGGYVITCNHVIKNENDIRIVFNGNELSAKLVLTDPNNDLALLKIEGSFPAIAFSKNRSAKMGEKVFTVGYPNPSIQGINLKYNSGNISSLTGFQDDVRLYQISVPVQPGNSGGPLLDENGNILGVIVSQLDAKTAFALTGTLPQNVNYAIKSIYAQAMLDTLPGISEKLVNPVKNNSNVIDKAKQSTVIVLCYSP